MTDHITETAERIDGLSYEPINPKYREEQTAITAIIYILLAGLGLTLLFADSPWWCIGAEAVIAVSCIINLAIVRKAFEFKGYAFRDNNITYRSGMIFPKVTTVPFSKIQQVTVRQNPVSKYYGLFAVEIVNGAQNLSSLTIPGLTIEKAEGIRDVITRKLNNGHD